MYAQHPYAKQLDAKHLDAKYPAHSLFVSPTTPSAASSQPTDTHTAGWDLSLFEICMAGGSVRPGCSANPVQQAVHTVAHGH